MNILDLPLSKDYVFSSEDVRYRCVPFVRCAKTGDRFVEYKGSKCLVTDKFNGFRVRGPIPILKSGRENDNL